jgi:hypothetical protein
MGRRNSALSPGTVAWIAAMEAAFGAGGIHLSDPSFRHHTRVCHDLDQLLA